MPSATKLPPAPEMVPASTTISSEVELALKYAAENESRTYAGQMRHVLTSFAKMNPAPRGWNPTKE